MSNRISPGRLLDLLMVSRPLVLVPVWGFCALGYHSALRVYSASAVRRCWHTVTPADYGWILLFSCSVAAVYIMNQIADIDVDRRNNGMPLIARGIISTRKAVLAATIYSLISLLPPLLLKRYSLVFAAVTALMTGYVYSFRPSRFSGRPFADFLSNAFGYGVIAFGIGWILAGRSVFSGWFLLNATPYFLLMCGGSISSTLPDMEADRIDGKNTTAVVLGLMPAHSIATVFVSGAAVAGFLIHDLFACICAAVSLPLYLLYWMKRRRLLMEATYKIGGVMCMATAFIAMPFFIPVAVIVFTATWLYFRIRHGITYPSLVPVARKK